MSAGDITRLNRMYACPEFAEEEYSHEKDELWKKFRQENLNKTLDARTEDEPTEKSKKLSKNRNEAGNSSRHHQQPIRGQTELSRIIGGSTIATMEQESSEDPENSTAELPVTSGKSGGSPKKPENFDSTRKPKKSHTREIPTKGVTEISEELESTAEKLLESLRNNTKHPKTSDKSKKLSKSILNDTTTEFINDELLESEKDLKNSDDESGFQAKIVFLKFVETLQQVAKAINFPIDLLTKMRAILNKILKIIEDQEDEPPK